MSDPYRQIRAGDGPLPAAALNAAVRGGLAALRMRGLRSNGQGAEFSRPATELLIKWTGEDALPVRSVVTYADAVISPEDKPLAVAESPVFEAGTPAASTDAFAITIEPCRVNAFARAVSTGIAVVDIDVTDEAHTHANATPDETARLTSAESGRAEILWKPEGTGVGKCVVLLGGGGGESCCSCVGVDNFTSSLVPNVTPLVITTPISSNIVYASQYVDVPGDAARVVMAATSAQSNNGINLTQVRARLVTISPSTGAVVSALTDWLEIIGGGTNSGNLQRTFAALIPAHGGTAKRVAFQYFANSNTGGIIFVGGYPGAYLIAFPASSLCSNSAATEPVPPPPPPPPSSIAVSFTARPTEGFAPLATAFNDTSTGSPIVWLWDFGDGTGSAEQHPNHTYTTPGVYTVTLTATNAAGDSGTATGTVIVWGKGAQIDAGQPLRAKLAPDKLTGTAPLAVGFGNQSKGGTEPRRYQLHYGDGAVNTDPDALAPHTYAEPGTYTATLVAIDAGGLVSLDTAVIVVELPPAAPGDGSLTANFGAAPPFATPPYTATFTDTSGTTGAAITGWAWTFGDGGTSSLQNPTHDYPGPGTYHVTLTVSHATDSDTAETDIVIP